MKQWTQQEIDYLKENLIDLGYKQCALHLQRSPASVDWKIQNLKLQRRPSPIIPKDIHNKICSICKEEKPRLEFWKEPRNKDGLFNWCPSCNKNKIKQWTTNTAKYKAHYYQQHKLKLRKYFARYVKQKRQNNIHFRILGCLRGRIWHALKGICKSDSTIKLIGCPIETLKIYLESLFQPKMSWKNYGQWHIDHIKPCSAFNLSIPSEQQKCFHFSNLQPLWAKDNLSKSDKFI